MGQCKDNFGKLIYLVTRQNLNVPDSGNPYIVLPDSEMNIGEGPSKITNGGTILNSLESKVDGLMLFANTVNSEIRADAITNQDDQTHNKSKPTLYQVYFGEIGSCIRTA